MPTATATVNGTTIASTDKWETVDGNIYFPPSSIESSLVSKTGTQTSCPWKGTASYYTINVNGNELKDAAWFYETPKTGAMNIKDHVAFYKNKVDIKVSE